MSSRVLNACAFLVLATAIALPGFTAEPTSKELSSLKAEVQQLKADLKKQADEIRQAKSGKSAPSGPDIDKRISQLEHAVNKEITPQVFNLGTKINSVESSLDQYSKKNAVAHGLHETRLWVQSNFVHK